ncbi:MAG: hypothetical protein DRP69_04900, partial [Candidatus Duberdicusella sinuisediminis]
EENILLGFTDKSFSGVNVSKEVRKVADILNFDFEGLSYLKQIHSSKVFWVRGSRNIYQGDSLFTLEKLRLLLIRTADCLPLFFYSYKDNLVGLIHLGWKPAYKGILENFFNKIGKFKIELESSYLLIGPGLRECCFEVKRDFMAFDFFKNFILKRREKYFLDLGSFVKNEFIKRGFKEKNVLDTQFCSQCLESFYSFRRDKTQDRTLSFILQR